MHRRAVTLAVCLAAAFTTLLDQSSLNTAVPALRASLDAGPGTVQWIIAGYSLTFGLALVPGGRLGDAYGRKWLFIGGVALFSTAAVVAGTAQHAWLVAVARLVQGVGAGTVNPQVLGVIQELFTGRDRARALGAYAVVGGISGVIGPLVGGTLIGALGEAAGWRCVLLLNVPFGLLTVPLALRWFPGGRRPTTGVRLPGLDLPGLAMLAIATLCLLLPFTLPDGQGPPLAVWFAAAPVAFALLLLWERGYARRGRNPVLLPALLGERGFRSGTLVAMFQFGASLSASLALTLYLQEVLGWSALHAALTTLPSALGFAAVSAVSWRVVARFGPSAVTWSLAVATAAVLAAATSLALLPAGHLGWALTLTQTVLGSATGMIVSPNQALTLAHAPPGTAGLAAAFLQLAQRISASIGTAVVAGIVLAASVHPGPTATLRALAVCALLATAAATAWRGHPRPPAPDPLSPAVRSSVKTYMVDRT